MEQDAYTKDFIQYAEDWDYFLVTVDDHQNLLENAGFERVSCSCCHLPFIDEIKSHLSKMKEKPESKMVSFL